MAKIHVALLQRYEGVIKVSGLKFDFETMAVSDGEAKNNGIAQYARKLNMTIAQLRTHMKNSNGSTTVSLHPDQSRRQSGSYEKARADDESVDTSVPEDTTQPDGQAPDEIR